MICSPWQLDQRGPVLQGSEQFSFGIARLRSCMYNHLVEATWRSDLKM